MTIEEINKRKEELNEVFDNAEIELRRAINLIHEAKFALQFVVTDEDTKRWSAKYPDMFDDFQYFHFN